MCASDNNHLLEKYYTAENSALNHDWTDEIGYIHPLFDGKIGKFVVQSAIARYESFSLCNLTEII